jgi:transposase-like protein
MEKIKELKPNEILLEWWSEVKEKFWEEEVTPKLKEFLKLLMEDTMKEELEVYTQAEWHERTGERIDYRNGYYKRGLTTRFGQIERIKVPRLRQGKFRTKVFKRYQRYQEVVEDLIEGIYLRGVSTAKLGQIMVKLVGQKISTTKVSNVLKRLDKKVKEFQRRQLLDEYQYLIFDAITLKARESGKVRKRKVLVCLGITMFGIKEIVAFKQVPEESERVWEGFINDLYRRGVKGENLKLIVTDGHKGLRNALEVVYPYSLKQLCWVHKERRILAYIPQKEKEECAEGIKKIYNARNKQEAIERFKEWKRKWNERRPRAVRCLEKDLEQLLYFYEMPKNHWKKIRTTNAIERAFREVRRRTKVLNIFMSRQSCDRIMYALFAHFNNNWREHPLKQFTQFS